MALSCPKNCGGCCGIIPVTKTELNNVRSAIRKKSKKEIQRLQSQTRDHNTCPMLDMENKRCSVYEDRPAICRAFGFYEGIACPKFPSEPVGSFMAGRLKIEDMQNGERLTGVIGRDFTWQKGLL